jgi:hypothetical protein
MNGYLMQDREWVPGEDLFIESVSPENSFGVVFEDDGESAYFYAVERDPGGTALQVLDALHIHEEAGEPEATEPGTETGATEPGTEPGATELGADPLPPAKLQILWSRDWLKCALVIDGRCHALFDFEAHGGYNINEFPPPNEIWTQGDRKLTDEIVKRLF